MLKNMRLNKKGQVVMCKPHRVCRTPFEQAAYDLQHTPKNRVSGPELGATAPIDETKGDKYNLVIAILFTLLVVMYGLMLMLV